MEKKGFYERNFNKIILISFLLIFIISYTYKFGAWYYDIITWAFFFGLLATFTSILGILMFPSALTFQTFFYKRMNFLPLSLSTAYTILAICALLVFLLFKKYKLNKDFNLFLIFGLGLMLFASTLFNGLPINFQNYEFVHYVDAIVIFLILTVFIRSGKETKILSWVLFLGIASIAFRLYNHTYSYDIAIPGFENNYLSRVLSFYVPFFIGMFWAEKKKLFKFIILFALAFTVQGITQLGSRATYLSLGIALPLLVIMNIRKKSTWVFVALGVIFLAFFVGPMFYRDVDSISKAKQGTQSEDASIRGRAQALEWGWQVFLENPVMGWGVNNARSENLINDRYGISKSIHNAYIIIAIEMGIIGLTIYILLFLFSIYLCFKTIILVRNKDKYFYNIANGTMFGLIAIGINQYMLNNPWIPDAFIGFGLSSALYGIAKRMKNEEELKPEEKEITHQKEDTKQNISLKNKQNKKSKHKRKLRNE